jgi:hypothetical protein
MGPAVLDGTGALVLSNGTNLDEFKTIINFSEEARWRGRAVLARSMGNKEGWVQGETGHFDEVPGL